MSKKIKKVRKKPLAQKSINVVALFQEAVGLQVAGELAKAEHLYLSIIQSFPKHAQALNHLGLIAQQQGKSKKAIDLTKKSLRVDRTPEAYSNLGAAYRSIGKLSEAITAFKNALSLKPSLFEAQFNLAETYLDIGNFEQAQSSFQKAYQGKQNVVEEGGEQINASIDSTST